MGTKLKSSLPLLLLLALLSLSTLCTTSQAKEDPQLQECRRQCSQKSRRQRDQCEQRCWEQHEQRGRGREHEGEAELVDQDNPRGDAEKHLEHCRQQCEEAQHGGAQRKQCEQRCQKTYEQEKGGREGERERGRGQERETWGEEEEDEGEGREEREGEKENPYVFKREHFKQKLGTEHGNMRVLTNFAKRSKLLLGIANYRVVLVELNPRTFVLPNHWDADSICYIVQGIFILFIS